MCYINRVLEGSLVCVDPVFLQGQRLVWFHCMAPSQHISSDMILINANHSRFTVYLFKSTVGIAEHGPSARAPVAPWGGGLGDLIIFALMLASSSGLFVWTELVLHTLKGVFRLEKSVDLDESASFCPDRVLNLVFLWSVFRLPSFLFST